MLSGFKPLTSPTLFPTCPLVSPHHRFSVQQSEWSCNCYDTSGDFASLLRALSSNLMSFQCTPSKSQGPYCSYNALKILPLLPHLSDLTCLPSFTVQPQMFPGYCCKGPSMLRSRGLCTHCSCHLDATCSVRPSSSPHIRQYFLSYPGSSDSHHLSPYALITTSYILF